MATKHKIILDILISLAIWTCLGYYVYTLFQDKLESDRQEAVALKLAEEEKVKQDRKKFVVIIKDTFYDLED